MSTRSSLLLMCGVVSTLIMAGCGGASGACPYLDDGGCDDGRPGSVTNLCPAGSDDADCVGVVAAPNSCLYANDGECDDGRPGAVTDACGPGTDEADCSP